MAPSHGDSSDVPLPPRLISWETDSVKGLVQRMDDEDGSEDSHGSASGDSDDCMDGFDSEGPAREMKSVTMGSLEDVSCP
jgi:hypothetical protein